MSFSSRPVTLTAFGISTLLVGIALGVSFAASPATAQGAPTVVPSQASTTRLTLTALLQVPGEQTFIFRIEDKEYGVVCYVSPTSSVASAYSLGCVKR